MAAGLDAPEDVAPTDGPSAAEEADAETEADAAPLGGPNGPSIAPAVTSRQTAHLDDHTAGRPGAMRSASHGLQHPASRTGEEEITGRSGIDYRPGTEIQSPAAITRRTRTIRTADPSGQEGRPVEIFSSKWAPRSETAVPEDGNWPTIWPSAYVLPGSSISLIVQPAAAAHSFAERMSL